MQLRIGETYIDDYNIKWSIVQKLPSKLYIGYSHEQPVERVRKFWENGQSYSGFNITSLREIEKEWFGIEVTLDGERKLVNGTFATKSEAERQANETWWKYQPEVVQLEVIK